MTGGIGCTASGGREGNKRLVDFRWVFKDVALPLEVGPLDSHKKFS